MKLSPYIAAFALLFSTSAVSGQEAPKDISPTVETIDMLADNAAQYLPQITIAGFVIMGFIIAADDGTDSTTGTN